MILSDFSINWHSVSMVNHTRHPEKIDKAVRFKTEEDANLLVKRLDDAATLWFGEEDDHGHCFEAVQEIDGTRFEGWVIVHWIESCDVEDDGSFLIDCGDTYIVSGFEFKAGV